MAEKLTGPQVRLLASIEAGNDSGQSLTLGALKRRGLIDCRGIGRDYFITDAGRAALLRYRAGIQENANG